MRVLKIAKTANDDAYTIEDDDFGVVVLLVESELPDFWPSVRG